MPVFDPKQHTRVLGFLQRGAVIYIVKAENKTLLRIRFTSGDTEREGLCRMDSLDLSGGDDEP
jgi:hypothetical protein